MPRQPIIDICRRDLFTAEAELYQKYKDFPTKDGLMFPPKSNQKMNDNLKVIAKKLGFTRDITKMQFSGKLRIDKTHRLCDVIGTHSARRTFVVHALEMGWSPQLVMSYTGHEDYDTMKPYIALTDKTRKQMMETNFWQDEKDDLKGKMAVAVFPFLHLQEKV